ncbi:MAG TPA: membrane protein insertase YidC [Rhizomicrobium sp.]|nr:membrane protein insertase YidC [Rhizomicrobium sp.]
MNENNRNLLLAIVLSAAVLFGWQYFMAKPQMEAQKAAQTKITEQQHQNGKAPIAPPDDAAIGAPAAHTRAPVKSTVLSRKDALAQSGARVAIDTPTVAGSLRLTGARFDDLRLKKYRETIDPKSPAIVLLAPSHTAFPYYVVFGWVAPNGSNIAVPDDKTPWKLVQGSVLQPGAPVVLQWDNGHGLTFKRTIAVDDQYMFTVNDAVINNSAEAVKLYPYAYVARDGVPKAQHYWVVHEGFVGVADGSLKDPTYDHFKDDGTEPETFKSTGGWLGITDKYWMAAVIPPQQDTFDGGFRAPKVNGIHAYQADYRLGARDIAPGQTVDVPHHLFAGAKVVSIIQGYEAKFGITHFDLAIDWGWFFFLTKPIFLLLDIFYRFIGNFGIAILLLTITIKLLFFPLANTSYKSMSRMKKLQPLMEKIKERNKDDKVKQQQEIMDLYKREKVNPVSGCLPMLLQIPVFFSLYKVLFVTIEMRHAPFFGWIHDLSAPDPTCFLNLFGLLPYDIPSFVPTFLLIGIWPMFMGITQWLQMKLNPAPTDPIQARMFAFMPIIFTAMMANFPAGLVIYWTWNNLLSSGQQYYIMRRQGVEVHLFENMMPKFLKEKMKRKASPAGE